MIAHSSDPEARTREEGLRRRVALLEEANAKAWSERTDLEARVASLERECSGASRTTAQALEAGARQVTELAVTVAELPSSLHLRKALDQLSWLEEPDRGSGHRHQLQELLSCLDSRVLAVEKSVRAAEHRIGPSEVAGGPEHEQLANVLQTRFQSLRAQLESKLESKSDRKDQDRLADALSQSCRDLTSTLRACRQDLATLDQNCKDLAQSVALYGQDMSRLDQGQLDLQRSVSKWEQDIKDLERQWSRRLWGYRDSSPSLPRRSAPRPCSGSRTYRADSPGKAPWKPWPTSAATSKPLSAVQQDENVQRSAYDTGNQRLGMPRICATFSDREG